MITVKRLKYLLQYLPDDAGVWGYEGEDVGISIEGKNSPDRPYWFIKASQDKEIDTYTEGFDE